jgi:hypothetical protein
MCHAIVSAAVEKPADINCTFRRRSYSFGGTGGNAAAMRNP